LFFWELWRRLKVQHNLSLLARWYLEFIYQFRLCLPVFLSSLMFESLKFKNAAILSLELAGNFRLQVWDETNHCKIDLCSFYCGCLVCFGGTGDFNSGLCTCNVGALLLKLHLQSILLWLFWRCGLETICPDWPQTSVLPISASQVPRIIGMSHCHPS
jgi:hypothetical protein